MRDCRGAPTEFAEVGLAQFLKFIRRCDTAHHAIGIDTEDLLPVTHGRPKVGRAPNPLPPDHFPGLMIDTGPNALVFPQVDPVSNHDRARDVRDIALNPPHFAQLAVLEHHRHGVLWLVGEPTGSDDEIARQDRRTDGPFLLLQIEHADIAQDLAAFWIHCGEAMLPIRKHHGSVPGYHRHRVTQSYALARNLPSLLSRFLIHRHQAALPVLVVVDHHQITMNHRGGSKTVAPFDRPEVRLPDLLPGVSQGGQGELLLCPPGKVDVFVVNCRRC